MATCPNGHESTATDYCDTCGVLMAPDPPNPGAPAAPTPAVPGTPAGDPAASGAAARGAGAAPESAGEQAGPEACPGCGAARTGRFCETCGFDFATGAAAPESTSAPASVTGAGAREAGTEAGAEAGTPPTGAWTATATADREYFDRVVAAGGPDAAAIDFPSYCPERRFVLRGSEMRIGRRSASRGLEPEIDLTGPPTDPGISHLHAVLSCEPDGSWSVLDPGSSNGTQVNGTDIATGVKVPLHDGDRISVGGWTVLSIHSA